VSTETRAGCCERRRGDIRQSERCARSCRLSGSRALRGSGCQVWRRAGCFGNSNVVKENFEAKASSLFLAR